MGTLHYDESGRFTTTTSSGTGAYAQGMLWPKPGESLMFEEDYTTEKLLDQEPDPPAEPEVKRVGRARKSIKPRRRGQ